MRCMYSHRADYVAFGVSCLSVSLKEFSLKVFKKKKKKKGRRGDTLEIATPSHGFWTLVTSDSLPLLGVSGFGWEGIFRAAFTRRPIATKKAYNIAF